MFDNVSQYSAYEEEIEVDTTSIKFVAPPNPTVLFGMVVDGLNVNNAEVKRNQRFSDLLDGYYVDGKAMRLLCHGTQKCFRLQKSSGP